MTRVLVLGGGPDAERRVSLDSAAAIADALRADGSFEVESVTIDSPDADQLAAMPGDVVFPALHGPFGEGGDLQDLLEQTARPYVGSGPKAARLSMDKLATKLAAARVGIGTPDACVFDPRTKACPIDLPLVIKPVQEGSSVGVHLIHDEQQWGCAFDAASRDAMRDPSRVYMVESLVQGRELTVGLIEQDGSLDALPVTEIVPADGFYDYDAKYARDDTSYLIDPDLPLGVAEQIVRDALKLARALGVRHLARVDFMLDADDKPWLLEINTMPGFTTHSLLPMAARIRGLDMPALCAHLVRCALAEHAIA